jgi:hypothetical protein
MAYVRKTETLVTEMVHKVKEMATRAKRPYQSESINSTHPMYEHVKQAAEKSAWDKAPELQDKMPIEWCTVIEHATVGIYDDAGNKLFSTSVETREDDRMKVPTTRNSSYYRYSAEVHPRHCSPALSNWINEQKTREERLRQVRTQYDTIEQQLKSFMSGQASLNSALKEMPELEMYVPYEYMEKYRKVDEPRSKKPRQNALLEEVGIDRDVFAAAAIAHRIATAAE